MIIIIMFIIITTVFTLAIVRQLGFNAYIEGSRNLKRIGHLDQGMISLFKL